MFLESRESGGQTSLERNALVAGNHGPSMAAALRMKLKEIQFSFDS